MAVALLLSAAGLLSLAVGRRRLAATLALAGAYYVAGKIALLLAIPPGYATAVWPPAGIALAGVLICGHRALPGVLLGSFLVNVSTSFDATNAEAILKSVSLATAIGGGAALQAFTGAFLVRRFADYPNPLALESEVLKFLALGGPVACLIGSTVGISCLSLFGAVPAGDFLFNWWTWWVGDTIGVLIFAPLVLVWAAKAGQAGRHRQLFVSIPLAFTFFLIVVLFLYTRAWEQRRIELEFEQRTHVLTAALEKDFGSYLELLRSVGNLYASSTDVNRQQFQAFVEPSLARHPGIKALSWNPTVGAARRDEFEKAARREGYPDFEIKERNLQGGVERARARSEYFPVYFIEPFDGNESVFGFDVASEPMRAEALVRARNTGEPTATRGLDLVQGNNSRLGILVFLPVYESRLTSAGEERRQAPLGYAVAVFEVPKMVAASLRSLDREGIDLSLYDKTDPAAEQLLYDPRADSPEVPVREEQSGKSAMLKRITTFELAGRRWGLEFSLAPGYLTAWRSWETWSVLAGGLLFTGILGAFLLVVTGRTARIEELVAQQTAEVQRSNRELREQITERNRAEEARQKEQVFLNAVLDNIEEGIVACNAEGTLTLFNRATREFHGLPEEPLPPEAWAEHYDLYLPDGKTRMKMEQVPLFRALQGEPVGDVELVVAPKHGPAHTLLASGRALVDAAGKKLGAVVALHDITERKRTEEALRESEGKYRDLFENSPVGIYRTTPDGRILMANPKLLQMLGYSSFDELAERNLEAEKSEPEYKRSEFKERVEREGEIKDWEALWTRRDSSVFFARENAKVVRGEDGAVLYYEGTVEDITKSKRAEDALRGSEERYRSLVENVGDMIYRISPDGHFLWVNPTASRIMGYPEQELIGMHFLDLVVKDWRQPVEKFYGRQLYKKIPTTYYEFPTLAKDGRKIWVGQNVQITFENNEVAEMHAIARDITERKLAEEALKQSETLLRSVIEGTPDAIFVKDLEGRYLLVNSATAGFLGKPVEEILGHNDYQLYPPDVAANFIEDDRRVAASAQTQTFEGSVTTANGITRNYSVTKAVYRDHEGRITGVIGISRDITERKQAEEELYESEERYRIVTETATEAIMTIDHESKILLANPAVEKIFGYTREELLGKELTMLMPEYLRQVHKAGLQRYLETGKRHLPWAAVEVPGLHKSGKEIPVELSLGEFVKNGKHFFTGVVRDISRRKLAEEVLRRENAFVDLTQSVAVAANEASTIQDAVWNCLDKICVLTKWPVGHLYLCAEDNEDALIPTTLWHLDDSKRFEKFVRATEKTRLASGSGLPGRVHASGKAAWVVDVTKDSNFPRAEAALATGIKSGVAFPILVFPTRPGSAKYEVAAVLEFFATEAFEPDEKLLEVMTIIGTQLGRVVERQRAEGALRESEERFSSFMRNLPGVATIKDAQGQYIYANEAFESTFLLKSNDWRGKTDDEVWPSGVADYFKEHDRRVLASRDVLQVTEAVPHQDGLHYWLVNKFPILDNDQTPVMVGGIAIDITERKQAEEELALKAEELARSNADLEQFAYVASHDLQEPLRMVSSYTELLGRRYKGRLDADADEFISYAVDGAARMQRLIQDLLEYSRIGTKGKEFELTDCERVLDRTLENLRLAIEESGAKVTHDPLPSVMADDLQLSQLLQNLIGNAIKFCKDRSPHVHVSAEQQENDWLFSVRDNGIGINSKYGERIFVIFQRLHPKTEYAGTGIGLAICKKIVERHGGRIWMESNPGEGTTFHFTLPKAYRGSPKLLYT